MTSLFGDINGRHFKLVLGHSVILKMEFQFSWILLLLAGVCYTQAGVISSDQIDFDAIYAAVNNRPSNVVSSQKEECFPDIGCFEIDGPMKHVGILPETPDKIGTKFYVYTASSGEAEHLVDPHKTETFKMIDTQKRLAIVIHGFGNSHTTDHLVAIKNSLLKQTDGEIGSVIVVDWKQGAELPFYNEASTNTQVVGRQVTFLVNELMTKHGVKAKNVYLIGFSLGAHCAGFAGKYSQSKYHWKYGRITGLDSAAPNFESYPGSFLTKDDADFVDAIHTSAGHNLLKGEIGFISQYGHVDFFPNGGHNQPMCHSILHPACNHHASSYFYEASLSAKSTCEFKAFACADYKTFEAHKCTKSDSTMGYYAEHFSVHGQQFLQTKANYPYCN